MTVSNKKLLIALAILAPEEISAFAIPFFGRATIQPKLHLTEATCGYAISVAAGDTCATLAERCNTTQNNLLRLNDRDDLCSNIASYDTICCETKIQPRSSRPASDDQENDEDGSQDEDQEQSGDHNQGGQSVDGTVDDQDPSQDNGNEETENGDQQDDTGGDQDGGPGGDQDGEPGGTNDTTTSSDGKINNTNDTTTNSDGKINNTNTTATNSDGKITAPPRHLPGPRTGNWTKLTCDFEAATNWTIDPGQRWSELDAPSAFKDMMDQFTKVDRPAGRSLLQSISLTLGLTERNCANILDGGCGGALDCTDIFSKNDTGPAGFLIMQSFINIHNMFAATYAALEKSQADNSPALDSFIDAFAPIKPPPEDNKWLDFLLEIATMGATAGLGRIVTTAFKTMPALAATGKANTAKDVAQTLLGTAIDEIESFNKDKKLGDWDVTQQHDLKSSLGRMYGQWGMLISNSLNNTFATNDSAIVQLGNLINGGKMLNSAVIPDSSLSDHFSTVMFTAAAPIAWRMSNNMAFVIDTGAKCGEKNIKGLDLDQNDFSKLGYCSDDNKQYYLAVVPDGPADRCPPGGATEKCDKNSLCTPIRCAPGGFAKPPGAQFLDGSNKNFGNIQAKDIIQGAINTYKANGNKNGGAKAVDHKNMDSIMAMGSDKDFQIPGLVRLPVCSHDVAWKGWMERKRTDDNYPC